MYVGRRIRSRNRTVPLRICSLVILPSVLVPIFFPSFLASFAIMDQSSSIGEGCGKGETASLEDVTFEVFGRVQGVFFRAHTEEQAKQLGLVGWCMNTPEGTVKGEIQGPPDKIEKMLHWLRHVGSPMSQIDKLEILGKKNIPKLTFHEFEIRRKKK